MLSRKRFIVFVMVLLSCSHVDAQADPKQQARAEVNSGVCAFKVKDYRKAQQHFEKALELDPTDKKLKYFIARTIFYQYDTDPKGEKRTAKGKDAIAAYGKLLSENPDDTEAPGLIARVYSDISHDRLADIAGDGTLPKAVRARIYVMLAAQGNSCANDITDAHQYVYKQGGKSEFRYTRPKDPAELTKAQTCAGSGSKFIEKALELAPNDESAVSYKASLLYEMSRLAEMEQNAIAKAEFRKKADAAREEFRKLSDAARERQRKADEDEALRWSKRQSRAKTDDMIDMAKFIATGGLTTEPAYNDSSVDVPDLVSPEPIGDSAGFERPQRAEDEKRAAKLPWKTFAPVGDAFSVLLPSPVTFSPSKDVTFYEVTAENVNYQIFSSKMAPGRPPTMDEYVLLAGIVWGNASATCNLVAGSQGSCGINLVRKITFGTRPGLHYRTIETYCDKKIPGVLETVSTADRIYIIRVRGAEEDDPRVTRALSSFTLKP